MIAPLTSAVEIEIDLIDVGSGDRSLPVTPAVITASICELHNGLVTTRSRGSEFTCHRGVHSSFYSPTRPSTHPSILPIICPSVRPSIHPTTRPSTTHPPYHAYHTPHYLSVYLSIGPSVRQIMRVQCLVCCYEEVDNATVMNVVRP